MFSFFANKLTAASNNYIDWSRTAELLFSKHHRYSMEEIAIRGAMVCTTAVFAFLGNQYNDEEKTGCSNTTLTLAAGTLGLAVSHVFIVGPLAYKRYKINVECKKLINEIHLKAKELSDFSMPSLEIVLHRILASSLADENRSNATLTWSRRKTLLTNLKKAIEINDEKLLFLFRINDIEKIVEQLEIPPSHNRKLIKIISR